MKTTILTLIFAFVALAGFTQPKTHVIYDTVINKRIDYLPDTIPVYFKELVMPAKDDDPKYRVPWEQWRSGYVIWQTYKKTAIQSYAFGTDVAGTYNTPEYYKDDFKPNIGRTETYLYEDKRRVTNVVLLVFKR